MRRHRALASRVQARGQRIVSSAPGSSAIGCGPKLVFWDEEQLMAEPEVEAAWRAEFKRIHDTEGFHSGPDDLKTGFRWPADEAEARRPQEEHTHYYLRWTFVGAFAAMIVGVIGVGLSFLH